MPTVKKTPTRSLKTSRKDVRLQIARKLENAFPDLKAILGDKKFHNRIKKASKLLSYDPAGLNGHAKEANGHVKATSRVKPATKTATRSPRVKRVEKAS